MKLHSFGKILSLIAVLTLVFALALAVAVTAAAESNAQAEEEMTLTVTAPYKECGKIKISWDKISGAYKYVVYNGDEFIANSTAGYYIVSKLDVAAYGDDEIVHSFKVVAVDKDGNVLASGTTDAVAQHVYVDTVTPPNCTEKGYTTHTCSCGDTYVDTYVDALGHTEAPVVVENNVNPDCVNEGSYDNVIYCSACGVELDRETVIVDPLGHEYGEWIDVIEPSCVDTGVLGHYNCGRCHLDFDGEYNELTDLVIPAKGHDYGDLIPEIPVQCEKDGQIAYYECSVCHVLFDESKREVSDLVIPMTGHSFTNYVYNGNASCGSDGTQTAECDNGCGKTDTIGKPGTGLDHSFTNYVSDGNAKCGKDGTKTAECDNGCGKTDTVTDVGSALTHKYTSYVSNNDATCTKDGTETALCDHGCGTTDMREAKDSKVPHTPAEAVKENVVAPGCVTPGSYDNVVYCSACQGELERTNVPVDATGHTEGTAVKENETTADCTNPGGYDTVVYCTVCHDEISREHKVVDALGHTEGTAVKENETIADCTNGAGYESVVYCTVCHTELSREYIGTDPLGHDWTDADCYTPKTCNVCGAVEGSMLGHDFAAANCTKPQTCRACGLTQGKALGHNFSEADCENDGVCTLCGVKQGLKIGHEYSPNLDEYIVFNYCDKCGDKGDFVKVQVPEKDRELVTKIAVVAGCLLVIILCIRALRRPATTTPWYKRRKYR